MWIKWKSKDPASFPLPRSGHSITQFKDKFYVFGGTLNGLLDPNIKKVGPTNEAWLLEANQKMFYNWTRLNIKGDIPPPRSNHIAVTVKRQDGPDNSIFIFGGMGDKGKFDDCYLFDVNETKFTKISTTEQGPSPRAGHSACTSAGRVYIYGGNGGRQYENSVFRDLWMFDTEKTTWTEIKYDMHQPLPECRTGHTMFMHDKNIFIYGGWNTLQAFYQAVKFDLAKNEWSTTSISNENFPVWNHCALEVEAGPGWKYFVFSGSSKVFDETKQRERAECMNNVLVADLETEVLEEVTLEDYTLMPFPREDAAMVYYQGNKSLLVFGGWNNEWFGDIYGICVSSIVGPSYSVKSLDPNMGKISGDQEIHLYGTKLSQGNILVFFIVGNKYKSATARWLSETEIAFDTPSFIEVGARDVEVRIKIESEELSTNPIKFSIYHDTKPDKTIFFGPACLDGSTPGVPTSFVVRARNEFNDNRVSGRDNFVVTVVSSGLESVPVNITDQNDGTYKVEFTAPKADKYKISVMLKEGKEPQINLVNVRESPILVTFDGEDPANNEFVGHHMANKFVKENVEMLENTLK